MLRKFFICLAIYSILYFNGNALNFDKSKTETKQLLNLFEEILKQVKKDYVTETNDKDLIKAALKGMLSSLDPHSAFLDEKEFEELYNHTKGEFAGLGLELTMENGIIKIISPIEESPADNAGIKAGDYIISINHEPVLGMTLTEAVDKMRGEVGKKVYLNIVRGKEGQKLEFVISRSIIKIKPVRSNIFGKIGYLKISSFSKPLTEEVENEINKIKKASPTLQGLVIDFRNNPGGLLDQSISITDLFLDKGEILSIRGRNKENTITYNAKKGDILQGLPIVIMINNGSASASEIVAGALQDHKRAVIIGTKSFGKGSVQTSMPFNPYGGITITTAKYYTPSGRSIQAEGIIPDIIVEQAKVEYTDKANSEKIYFETSLKNHIPNERKIEGNIEISNNSQEPQEDYQLARALDVIKAINIFKPNEF